MRFSAAIQPKQLLRTPATAELARRLLGAEEAPQRPAPPVVERVRDLPADLDQRVRLVGEW